MKPSLAVQIAGQIAVQIEELRGTGGTELRQRYREVFGELPKTSNQYHLRRRIAWSLQARALGDISARAQAKAIEILEGRLDGVRQRRKPSDRRVPEPGTELTRVYRDRTILVKVLANGFECEGQHYDSLSAAATAATGTRWNGLVFFGLAKRGASVKRSRRKHPANKEEASRAA